MSSSTRGQERTKAFIDHYGPHPELLDNGEGTILRSPVVVTKFDPGTHYAVLKPANYQEYVPGKVSEIVEFAEDKNSKPVQRNRLVEFTALDGRNILGMTTRLVLVYPVGQGYARWTAFEPTPPASKRKRINPVNASLTLEFRPSLSSDLRLGMAHFNVSKLDFVTLSQADQEEARRLHAKDRYNGNQTPLGVSVLTERGKLMVYDWQAGSEDKISLGEMSRGKTFTDPGLRVELERAEVSSGNKVGQVITRAWNPVNDVELLLAVPVVNVDWYKKAQGSSMEFPDARSLFPATYRHGVGKTNLKG